MEESSRDSTRKGKRSTRKTSDIDPKRALEILQQSVKDCLKVGLKASMLIFPDRVEIILNGFAYENGDLRIIEVVENE